MCINRCDTIPYHFMADTFDMVNATRLGCHNINMNAAVAHMGAMQSLYTMPSFNIGQYIPYNDVNHYNNLCNPWFAAWQVGTGNTGSGSFGNWSNCGNASWMPSFITPPGVVSPGTSTKNEGDKKTEEEKREEEVQNTLYTKKFNKLLALLKQVKNHPELSEEQVTRIDVAIKNANKGKPKERYESLKAIYDSITDKSIIVESLYESGLNVTDYKVDLQSKDSFYQRLLDAGFESNSTIDDKLTTMHSDIAGIKNKDTKAEEAEGIADSISEIESMEILDLISSWNSKYKGEDDKRLLSHIGKYYNDLKNKSTRSTFYTGVVTKLVGALTDEATKCKEGLDEESKKAIDAAVTKVNEALADSEKKIEEDLIKAFDNLYLLTRKAKMTILCDDAAKYYGEIDTAVFNSEMFNDKVVEDLKDEGFTDEQIKNAGVSLEKNGGTTPGKENKPDGNGNDEKGVTPEEAKSIGKSVYKDLSSWTTKSRSNVVKVNLGKINEDNVLAFLKGYYEVGAHNREGLIEFLNDDAETVTKQEIYDLIQDVLDKAEKMNLKNSTEYNDLKQLLQEHKDSKEEDLSNAYDGLGWLWQHQYKEEFDARLKNLYDKMVLEEKKQQEQK